jgi:hypothetical protein
MDQDLLVTSGQELIKLLDAKGTKPRAALWVYNPDNDIWRLWIVPPANIADKNQFYQLMADVISKNRDQLHGLDISATEFVKDNHPAILGMNRFMRMEGIGSAHVSNNQFNGFYLPDGIVLRMAV